MFIFLSKFSRNFLEKLTFHFISFHLPHTGMSKNPNISLHFISQLSWDETLRVSSSSLVETKNMYTYREMNYCHSSLTPLWLQEVHRYKEHTCSNPIEMVDNPMGWWKQHGHHFPTLSRLACRFLTISETSCPVERLFSVVGQVDTVRRASLSPDTMTLLVFLYEELVLVRKIRVSRIVRETLED